MANKYGVCSSCGGTLEPIWFTETEIKTTRDGILYKTGRKRRAVDFLSCTCCFKKYAVDDSFDFPWMNEKEYDKVWS